jgi:ubiquinone/menaquinone biosynthesis C-methylase UbiE
MAGVLWTGRLSPSTKLITNVNNLVAFVRGQTRNSAEMKARVKGGYEGAYSEHVQGYDTYGLTIMAQAAAAELEGVELPGKEVLDVGCGTGIMSFLALERGATRVLGGDVSSLMVGRAQAKARAGGRSPEQVAFREMDAESLPLPDASFDLVLSSLALGMVPNQRKAVAEMARVLRPGGRVVVGVHGREYLWEAQDAAFRAAPRQWLLGYRPEFWPMTPRVAVRLFHQAGLKETQVRELRWKNHFESGGDAWDFYAAISGLWWYERFPAEERARDAARLRGIFERAGLKDLTEHIVVVSGLKR